jgi:hypothetical protein
MPDQIKSKKNLLGRQVVKTKVTFQNSSGQDDSLSKIRTVYDKKGNKIKSIGRGKTIEKRDAFGQKEKGHSTKKVTKQYFKDGQESKRIERTNYGYGGKSQLKSRFVKRTVQNSNSNTSKPSDTVIYKDVARGRARKGVERNVGVSKYQNDEQNVHDRRTPSTSVGQAKLYRGAVGQAKSQARKIKKNK